MPTQQGRESDPTAKGMLFAREIVAEAPLTGLSFNFCLTGPSYKELVIAS